ncbi:hypothetical protein [Yinghuangia seranimata]|uniref:hypothetical protein n=1 Tax=Yinghuangia seranimata TaxID=408067 RepID=UPI00248D04F4|nr:hypothetical protein [Yinghuangia seranimata]MDI2126360.1 hypothetical protein [Yinghuangia seranimata]
MHLISIVNLDPTTVFEWLGRAAAVVNAVRAVAGVVRRRRATPAAGERPAGS